MQFNEVLDQLKIYEAGKPIELVVREYGIDAKDVIKLASNENPRGCSSKVIEAVRNEATKMNLYPDDSMYELKEALATKYGVSEANVIIGAGIDQVISFAVHAKANANTKVLMAGITFAMYEIYALQTGAKILKTPTAGHNLQEMLEIYKANKDISVIFLCLPNNPLGECLDTKDVYAFLDEINTAPIALSQLFAHSSNVIFTVFSSTIIASSNSSLPCAFMQSSCHFSLSYLYISIKFKLSLIV